MNVYTPINYVLLLSLLILIPVSTLQADDDHLRARKLVDQGVIMPLADILKIAKQKLPGKLLEVELESKDKQTVYEIEILSEDGIVREIYINAKTGDIISSKIEN